MGLRPSAIILWDHYALNRNTLTGEPDEEVIWQPFDFAVLNAVQTLEEMIDNTTGLPLWLLANPKVHIKVTSRINKVKKALDDFEKGKGEKGLTPGEEMTVKPYVPGSDKLPTLSEWVDSGGFNQPLSEDSTEDFPENGSPMTKFADQFVPERKKPEEMKKGWVNPNL